MPAIAHLLDAIDKEGRAALVRLTRAQGSTPREAGAWMVVRPSGGFHGTIGGGALEWEVTRQGLEALLNGGGQSQTFTHSLGPDLGQCCGGRVSGTIEVFDASRRDQLSALQVQDADDMPGQVLLFGAGHVGRAIVLALANLPFQTRWIDSRSEAFPAASPANASPVLSAFPAAEIQRAPAGAFILIMTHSHALDLDIAAAALSEKRFAYVGLIGSSTKRARFEARFRALGIAEAEIAGLVCPIGMPGINGKQPAVIAASVAAQLLARKYAKAPA